MMWQSYFDIAHGFSLSLPLPTLTYLHHHPQAQTPQLTNQIILS